MGARAAMQPRWINGDRNFGEQKLMLDNTHVASVARNHVGGWWYSATDIAYQIPYTSTLETLPGFKDANTAKRAAFLYVINRLQPIKK